MTAIDPGLLDEGSPIPDEDTLLAADPSGAWGALVLLRADAVEQTPDPLPVPDLDAMARWSGGVPRTGDESVPFYARHSLLVAEMLEGCLDDLAPAEGRRLAAAPDRGPAADPWPARYAGGGWRVVLGVDEAGWLYYAIEEAPEGSPGDGALQLDDLGLTLTSETRAGTAGGIGDAEELLGGHDFNPVRTLSLAGTTLRREV